MKALLLENIHPEGIGCSTERGIEVETVRGRARRGRAGRGAARRRSCSASGRRPMSPRAVLDAAPDLLAIGAFCIGTNQIDLAAAAARGVAVFNAPFSNTRSVVELAIAEIIALARHLTDKNAAMHAGVWDKSAKGAHEVRGRTLGIVGYGNIGSQLSVVAESLGMRVLLLRRRRQARPRQRPALRHASTSCSSVAETVTPARRRPSRQRRAVRRRAVRQDAAAQPVPQPVPRLRRRPRRAARAPALAGTSPARRWTCSPTEPKAQGDPFVSEPAGPPNVILTPHVGGSTEEAQHDIGRFVAGKLRDYADGGRRRMSVNLPQVGPATPAGAAGSLHVHHNVPGVLATVNGVLADSGVNIEGQTLSTRGELGYVITDVAGRSTTVPRQAAGPAGDGPAADHRLRLSSSSAVPARTSRSGSQAGQRGSARACSTDHQPTSATSWGSAGRGRASAGAGATNVTHTWAWPRSVENSSDSR